MSTLYDEIFCAGTVPYARQRYPTIGDWTLSPESSIGSPHKTIEIRVARMNEPDYEFLVALHELIEAKLCEKVGVTPAQIDKFDFAYEQARKNGVAAPCGCIPTAESEPGDDGHAPYRTQHQLATRIERLVCQTIGVDWLRYDQFVREFEEDNRNA